MGSLTQNKINAKLLLFVEKIEMDSWLLRFPAVGELLLAMATIPVVLVGVHLAAVRALMEIGQALCSAVWETVRPSNRAATGSPLFEQRLARPRNILITGASSGIGRALAVKYSAPGVVLVLGGRNASMLELGRRKTRQ